MIEAVDKERWHDADALLFGAKYDSLPLLLERTLAADSGDPVTGYVTFLAAKQMVERIRRDRREFWRAQRAGAGRLQSALEHLSTIQAALGLDDEHGGNFLEWFEPAFLRDLSHKIPSDEDDHA